MPISYLQYKQPEEAIPKVIRHSIYDKKVGVVVCLTGGSQQKIGAGKSFTALRLGEVIDKRFSVDDICMTPLEFLDRLNYYEEHKQIGRVIIMDESEIALASDQYYQFNNRAIGQTMQTSRYLRACAIFVTPSFSWIDSRVRRLVSYWGTTTLNIRNGKPHCTLKMYSINTNMIGDKMWPKRLTFYDKTNNQLVVGNAYDVGLPSQALIEAYEKKSWEFKQQNRKKLRADAELLEQNIRGIGGTAVTKQDLPKLARELILDADVQHSLSTRGKISGPEVMLIKPLSQVYAAAVATMINSLYRRTQETGKVEE